jgi:hypothetical protein
MDGQVRSPLGIAHDRRPELGVGRQPDLVRRLAEEGDEEMPCSAAMARFLRWASMAG